MKTIHRRLIAGAAALAACAPLAEAHPGHSGPDLTWDFSTGFIHPFTGLDHILAALAVGWWAVQLGGRARWSVPLAFVALMSIGAGCGRFGSGIPGVEQAVAASVLVLGVLVASSVRLPTSVTALLVGGFALFHGFAHGAEIGSGGVAPLMGFALATAVLLGAGLALGSAAARLPASVARVAGGAIALCGAVLLVMS